MKGLDTNVLVRYLVKDDKKQAEKASAYLRKIIAAGDICFINSIVLCELVWVLESAYDYNKQRRRKSLSRIKAHLKQTRQDRKKELPEQFNVNTF